MSNSVFQSVIIQLKEVSDRVFGVIDTDGSVISCTDVALLGERWSDAALKVGNSAEPIVTFGQKTFKAIVGNSNFFEFAVFCSGDDDAARSLCQLAYIALNDAKVFYEEKHDRGTFVKNIIMDNILPGDIYIRAKELHFITDAPRAVFLIRQVGHSDVATVDVLSGMFPDKLQDFVLSINETDIAVVKQITPATTAEDLEKIGEECQIFVGDWERIMPDGSRVPVEVPGEVSAKRKEEVVIETVLPNDIKLGTSLCMRSSQQDMKMYIDGDLRQYYTTRDTRLFGRNSMSVFVFVEVYPDDSGKTLQIRTMSDSVYTGHLNELYVGREMVIWDYFMSLYGLEMVVGLCTMVLGIAVILASEMVRRFYHKNITLHYLGWGVFLVSFCRVM